MRIENVAYLFVEKFFKVFGVIGNFHICLNKPCIVGIVGTDNSNKQHLMYNDNCKKNYKHLILKDQQKQNAIINIFNDDQEIDYNKKKWKINNYIYFEYKKGGDKKEEKKEEQNKPKKISSQQEKVEKKEEQNMPKKISNQQEKEDKKEEMSNLPKNEKKIATLLKKNLDASEKRERYDPYSIENTIRPNLKVSQIVLGFPERKVPLNDGPKNIKPKKKGYSLSVPKERKKKKYEKF